MGRSVEWYSRRAKRSGCWVDALIETLMLNMVPAEAADDMVMGIWTSREHNHPRPFPILNVHEFMILYFSLLVCDKERTPSSSERQRKATIALVLQTYISYRIHVFQLLMFFPTRATVSNWLRFACWACVWGPTLASDLNLHWGFVFPVIPLKFCERLNTPTSLSQPLLVWPEGISLLE